MTQGEKDLLLQDLCARLPYGVITNHQGYIQELTVIALEDIIYSGHEVKPYLRPMSSMTKSEIEELSELCSGIVWKKDILRDEVLDIYYRHDALDWLLKHHFDTRGLIPMGLALIAPKGMYD